MKASVIVLTYNANPEKLKMTLKSVIGQKCDDFEIIIADDGSKTRWDDETEQFFHKYGFEKYNFAGKCKGFKVKSVLSFNADISTQTIKKTIVIE